MRQKEKRNSFLLGVGRKTKKDAISKITLELDLEIQPSEQRVQTYETSRWKLQEVWGAWVTSRVRGQSPPKVDWRRSLD